MFYIIKRQPFHIALTLWLIALLSACGGSNEDSSKSTNIREGDSGLPFAPSLTNTNNLLRDSLSSYTEEKSIDFGSIHPAHHTIDHRVQIDNCDQVGINDDQYCSSRDIDNDGLLDVNPCYESGVCLFNALPESQKTPLSRSKETSKSVPFSINPNELHASTLEYALNSRGHRFICDASADTPMGKLDPSVGTKYPRACSIGSNGVADHDCYDITIMSVVNGYEGCSSSSCIKTELWGRDVTVVVEKPKTDAARIIDVLYRDQPKRSPERLSNHSFFTPVVSGDGRLLIFGTTDGMEYSVNHPDSGGGPCDVEHWNNFKSITEMYNDPNASAYGLAQLPIRDTENNILQPEHPLPGGYLWIDRNASMLFFNSARSTPSVYWNPDSKKMEMAYKIMAIDENSTYTLDEILNSTTYNEASIKLQDVINQGNHGFAFFGLWTNNKIIVPDTILNKNNLGIGIDRLFTLDLYHDNPSGENVMTGHVRRKGTPENRFYYLDNMLPENPSDIIWHVSTERDTAEMSFDDYVTRNALIVAPMNSSVTADLTGSRSYYYNNGFAHIRNPKYQGLGFTKKPRLQNTATSVPDQLKDYAPSAFSMWEIPAYGEILGGGRVEPIAAGGIHGAGLFLNGSNYVNFNIPTQNRSMIVPWYYGLWIEPKSTNNNSVLISFPDGTELSRLDENNLLITKSGFQKIVKLPSKLKSNDSQWMHIAFIVRPRLNGTETKVDFYFNGYHSSSIWVKAPIFNLSAGSLYLGGGPNKVGFKGWIDNFKIISHIPNEEEICRQAEGTLVGVNNDNSAEWEFANSFPARSHSMISNKIKKSFQAYYCEQKINPPINSNYHCIDNIRRTHLQPDATRCIGSSLLSPEGALFYDLARPDSSDNKFCHSCHVNSHPSETLRRSALISTAGTPLLPLDHRRQPIQPPSRIFGVIPKGVYGNMHDFSIDSGPSGIQVDTFILESYQD